MLLRCIPTQRKPAVTNDHMTVKTTSSAHAGLFEVLRARQDKLI